MHPRVTVSTQIPDLRDLRPLPEAWAAASHREWDILTAGSRPL